MTSIRRLYILLCGYEVIPKTISTRDKGGRFILSQPICAYLLDTVYPIRLSTSRSSAMVKVKNR
jgi:hypothetical protein